MVTQKPEGAEGRERPSGGGAEEREKPSDGGAEERGHQVEGLREPPGVTEMCTLL